jgi:steroid delta-isomerase-like uncharacterized protein
MIQRKRVVVRNEFLSLASLCSQVASALAPNQRSEMPTLGAAGEDAELRDGRRPGSASKEMTRMARRRRLAGTKNLPHDETGRLPVYLLQRNIPRGAWRTRSRDICLFSGGEIGRSPDAGCRCCRYRGHRPEYLEVQTMAEAKDLIDGFWSALERHDWDAVGGRVDAQGECVMPGGMRIPGAQIVPFLQAYVAAFPDLRHEVVDYVENGDGIAVELRVTATHTGPFHTPQGTVPATGRPMVWKSVDFIRIADGKIRSWHTYFDQLTFLQQLGLMPAPEPVTA